MSGPSRDRSRSLTQQMIEDLRWHIDAVSNNLGRADAAKHIGGFSIEDLRWHIGAAKEDLEKVAAARPVQWFRDHAAIIAAVSLFLTAALAVFAGVQTYAINGGLQQQVTSLENKLADVGGFDRAITSLVDDQVGKGNISLQTVQQYLPGGQGLSLAGQALIITSPARPSASEPAVVPGVITVTGSINTELKGREIWILTSTPGINRFYPQGSWPDKVGPAILDANHQWASPTVLVGAPGDKGRIFYVIAVLADANASGIFWQYLKAGASTHAFPGLDPMPQGAIEYDRVEVARS